MADPDDATSVRAEFEASLEQLQSEANRYAALDHSPDNLEELLAERARLDRQRARTHVAKRRVALRYEPPAPDHVDSPSGTADTSVRGKFLATIGAASMVGVLIAGFFAVQAFWASRFPPAEITLIDEQIAVSESGHCRWNPTFLVENHDSVAHEITGATAVIDRAERVGSVNPNVVIGPGQTARVEALIPAASGRVGSCPSLDELDVAVARLKITANGTTAEVKASLG